MPIVMNVMEWPRAGRSGYVLSDLPLMDTDTWSMRKRHRLLYKEYFVLAVMKLVLTRLVDSALWWICNDFQNL